MANFPALFRNQSNGRNENLTPADGGLEIDVIDCAQASSTVSLFSTVDTTGSLALFSSWDDTANVGAATSVFAFQGGITVAENATITGNLTVNGNMDFGNAAGDSITMTGSVDSDITFENSGARAITIDSQALTVSTTTSGKLTVDGVGEVEINSGTNVDINATTAVAIDAADASQFVVSGAAADLTLGARGSTITLSEASHASLDTNFTATSLIGALNELKTTNLGITTPSVKASEIISAGDVIYIDWDAGNARAGIYLADNTDTTKQNPVGVALNGGAIGTDIYIGGMGQEVIINTLIGANEEGNPVYLDTTGSVTLAAPNLAPVGTASSGDTSQIIGFVTEAGAAGAAKIVVTLYPPDIL